MKEYNFTEIEKYWQQFWADNKIYKVTEDTTKPKYYVLDMFPYPSGAGLHVGHPLGYIASDIYSRYKTLKGFNVLHPMGYDSFGLPAEQYAIQTGQQPEITTEQNINKYREQLEKLGFSYDWDREVRTSNPDYYKWTQWIFIQLFNSWYNPKTNKAEHIDTLINIFENEGFFGVDDTILTGGIELDFGAFTRDEWKVFEEETKHKILLGFRLAFLSEAYVNWCPALGTVLSNDEIKDGVSERGGYPVERKLMKQWSMRITAYAERLLLGLDNLDWTESLKESQRNWIGKSQGASLHFNVQDSNLDIEVFTTRPDTIFGISYLAIAPEHDMLMDIVHPDYESNVMAYVEMAKNRSERDRQADIKRITGEFTGAYAIHPFNGNEIPIWVADYVLVGYGTGAVMAVPAHDSRDFAFAKHFDLPIIQVIKPNNEEALQATSIQESYDGKEGILYNSKFLDGLEVKKAIKRAIHEIESRGFGKGKTNYRLRDAIFGRQRYWGEPIPIYYKNNIPFVLNYDELPLELPKIDKFLPTESGEPPLGRAKDWKYKGEYNYENSTMPGWAGSSWYFLRYMDNKNNNEFVSKQAVDYWQQVDLYLGGSEHATGHLLYIRFWTKFLFDLGLIPCDEPAKKLINQGMITGVSEKIYKVFGTPSNEKLEHDFIQFNSPLENSKLKPHKNIKTYFVSADVIKKQVSEKLDDKFSLLNVPIYYTKNSELNIEKYFEFLSTDDKDSAFIVDEDGYFYQGNWYNNNGILEPNAARSFFTKPEIEKMSKSKYNVVTPDEIVANYGADTLRLYEMFLGPLEQSKPWNTNGIEGVHRFLKKFCRLFFDVEGNLIVNKEDPTKAELKILHKTIKKVTDDIENFSFNTSVSNFMICVNELTDLKCNKQSILQELLIILSPYAPHIAEELWNKLGNKESITKATFPIFNGEYLVENEFSYPISINGKHRTNLTFSMDLSALEIETAVLANELVQKWLEGKTPKKVVFVKGKIVNLVT
ncbi:MAG: class I tRNA ligase family protein [Bacteroidota bacterium]|jgi:leucyl-tRNA synthetase